MLRPIWALTILSFAALPIFSQTVTLYDSTGDAIESNDSIYSNGPLGFSFTTGGTASNLSDVKLSLTYEIEGGLRSDAKVRSRAHVAATNAKPSRIPKPSQTARPETLTLSGPGIIVEICANTAGPEPTTPCTTIGAVNDSSITAGSSALVDVPVSPTVPLSANTTYWIILTVPDSTSLGLDWSATDAGTGVVGQYYFIGGGETFPNTDGPYIASVTASLATTAPPTTPAPPTLLLTLASLGCLGAWLGWRRLTHQRS